MYKKYVSRAPWKMASEILNKKTLHPTIPDLVEKILNVSSNLWYQVNKQLKQWAEEYWEKIWVGNTYKYVGLYSIELRFRLKLNFMTGTKYHIMIITCPNLSTRMCGEIFSNCHCWVWWRWSFIRIGLCARVFEHSLLKH